MKQIEAPPTTTPPVGTWVLLGRHMVVLAAILAVYARVSSAAADDFLVSWPAVCAMVFALSAVIAGLALLFFTTRERGKSIVTFRNAAWTISLLLFVDPLSRFLEFTPAKLPAASSAPSSDLRPAAMTPPPQSPTVTAIEATVSADRPARMAGRAPGCPSQSDASLSVRRATLAKVRQDYSDLAGLDDAAVVRAVHEAFYKDMPIDCIAYSLGVRLPHVSAQPAPNGTGLAEFLRSLPDQTPAVRQPAASSPG